MENLEPKKPVKTYSNVRKLNQKASARPETRKLKTVVVIKRDVLTTKKAVELLLSGTLKKKVCRYCLNITYPLSELDQLMQIGGNGAIYKVTIRDVVASVHPFKVTDDPNFPNKICEKCLNEALRAYIFAQQCDQAERALRNCFEDMYDKLNKLDPLERQKKRGRQKTHPNHNVLYTEHRNVIDYAEPIINLINSSAVSVTNEPQMSELECKRCWQVLPNLESLVNHEKIHPKTMWYHCRICGKSFAKRYQINRHLRHHAKETNPNLEESQTGFICNQCGHATDSYNVHLQHIEKHKFKMVLEHLVDREMDKLCAICFDNKGPMVQMDKMVCLHGGYPELTGDRSLYNILGATVPEPNYKYQELPVAQKPRIMTITKKINKNTTDVDDFTDSRLSLSPPVIVPLENKEYNESYTYISGDVQNLNEDRHPKSTYFLNEQIFEETTQFDEGISDERNNETVDMSNTDTHDKHDDDLESNDGLFTEVTREFDQNIPNNNTFELFDDETYDNIQNIYDKSGNDDLIEENNTTIHFVFSKPDLVDIKNKNIEGINNEIEQKNQIDNLCTYCWVFKKAVCKSCMDIEESTNRDTNTENIAAVKDVQATIEMAGTTKRCQYCWLFQNTDKCDYCHSTKEIESVFPTSSNEMQDKIAFISITESKETTFELNDSVEKGRVNKRKVDAETELHEPLCENRANKRKADNTTTVPAKRTKWQCNICLTNNVNREACLCCDSTNIPEDTLKLNFSFKTSFLDFLKTATPKVEEKFDTNDTEKKVDIDLKPLQANTEINSNSITTTETVTTAPKVVFFTAKPNNNTQDINKPNQKEETMEIAEENTPSPSFSTALMHSYPNPYSFAFSSSPFQFRPQMMLPAFQNAPFQFNMGATPENKGRHQRKFKRFMRKM